MKKLIVLILLLLLGYNLPLMGHYPCEDYGEGGPLPPWILKRQAPITEPVCFCSGHFYLFKNSNGESYSATSGFDFTNEILGCALERELKGQSITQLNILNCHRITIIPQSIVALEKLESLYLNRCTCLTLDALAVLKNLPLLKNLSLLHCQNFADEDILAHRETLPSCKIDFYPDSVPKRRLNNTEGNHGGGFLVPSTEF